MVEPPLVALAEDLEEQFRPGPGQGYEAQLVDDQQVEPGQLFLQVQQAPFVPGLHHLMHQTGGGGEAHGHARAGRRPSPVPGPRGSCRCRCLPTAMTFSRCWMYSQRASSITSALFSDGMAGKSRVSRLFTAGKRAARIRRSIMRWWRSMSSISARLQQVLGMVYTLGGALGSHLTVFPEKAGQLQLLQVVFQ